MDSAGLIQEGQVNTKHNLSLSGSVDASITVPTNSATNLDFTSAAIEFTCTF